MKLFIWYGVFFYIGYGPRGVAYCIEADVASARQKLIDKYRRTRMPEPVQAYFRSRIQQEPDEIINLDKPHAGWWG